MDEELIEIAQSLAEDILNLEEGSRQDVLDVFLENLDSETRSLLAQALLV